MPAAWIMVICFATAGLVLTGPTSSGRSRFVLRVRWRRNGSIPDLIADIQHVLEHKMMEDKVKENRVRRIASRRGYVLKKSRRRDPHAVDFGGYLLMDVRRNFAVLGGQGYAYSATLDEIEDYLDAGGSAKS
jgi:hypothetical protein